MTTLGQAYVQIMPSAKGMAKALKKELDMEIPNAGKSAGKSLASAMADSLGSAGSTLTKAITVPLLGATTAIGGLIGALGFKRLVGIDTAQAKLKGLGHDAESVEAIMDSALDAVRGTAYGLDEAATSAANAVAAGIAPGQDLTRYLGLAGDAAAIAGSSMGEMGSIFGKVQTAQKAYTGELNQLADRGIPIFQWLAEEAGTTAEGVREMASDGAISSEMFLAAIESNIGGAAKTMGEESFTAGIANIGAAIGRVGAEFLDAGGKGGGFFSTLKPLMSEMIDIVDNFGANAADLGVKFGEAFTGIVEKIRDAVQWWTSLEGSTQKLILTVAGLAVAAGPVLLILSKIITTAITLSKGFAMLKVGAGIVSTALGAISTPVLVVIGVIAGLIALFTVLYQKNEGFRDLVQNVWGVIKETISTVIQTVSDFVMGVFGGLVTWWNENNQLIMETIRVVWETVQQVVMGVINALVPYIQQAWSIIKIATTTVWNVIKTVIQTVINTVLGIIKTVMQIITGDWSGAWQTIKNTVSNVLSGIVSIISSLLSGAFNIIKNILGSIKNSFSTIFNGLRGIVSGAFSKVTGAVRDGLTRAFNTVKGFFTKFKNAGRNIVTSIADGIKGAIGKVTGAISNVVGKVRDFLPFSPPKIGPLTDIMDVEWGETIGAGIEKGESAVTKAMDKILDIDLTKKANFNDIRQNGETYPHNSQHNQPITLQIDGKTFAQIMGDYTSAEGGERIRRIERGLA